MIAKQVHLISFLQVICIFSLSFKYVSFFLEKFLNLFTETKYRLLSETNKLKNKNNNKSREKKFCFRRLLMKLMDIFVPTN